MPTVFDEAWAIAAGVLDGHFGEEFELTVVARSVPGKRVDVNAPTKAAPGQDTIVFVGIWGLEAVERFPDSRGHSSSDAQSFTSALASVEYDTASVSVTPMGQDRIKRLRTGAVYEITDAGDEVLGRRTLKLSARRG